MGNERDMVAIEAKLERCRELKQKSGCEFTRAHLKQLAEDLQNELNHLGNVTSQLGF